jgi:hypothetical protein
LGIIWQGQHPEKLRQRERREENVRQEEEKIVDDSRKKITENYGIINKCSFHPK